LPGAASAEAARIGEFPGVRFADNLASIAVIFSATPGMFGAARMIYLLGRSDYGKTQIAACTATTICIFFKEIRSD
jgi:hypothetical protein